MTKVNFTKDTKCFYAEHAGYDFEATYVTKQQLDNMNVRYYFSKYNDDKDCPTWHIYHDGNYHNFYYSEF